MNTVLAGTSGWTIDALRADRPRRDLRGLVAAALALAMTVSIAVVLQPVIADRGERATEQAEAAAGAAAGTQLVDAGDVPAGLNAGEWADIQREIARTASVAAAASTSALPSSLAAAPQIASAATVARFLPGAVSVTSTITDIGISLRTTSIGEVAAATPSGVAVGEEVRYQHAPAITEWYRDTAGGLQQGFTITEPVTTGPVTAIEVAVGGGTPTLVDPTTVHITTATGESFVYSGLIAWDATGDLLDATMAVAGGSIILNVVTDGAVYPVTVDPTIEPGSKTVPRPFNAGGRFGWSVDIDGNRMAVGAVQITDDDLGFSGDGGVYMYQRASAGSPWVPDGEILDPSVGPDFRFGDSVAVIGDQVAIGESDRLVGQTRPGEVHVFVRTGASTWVRRGLSISATAAYDAFGASVAWQTADKLVVGSPEYNGTGAVYQVTWNAGLVAWNAPSRLTSVVAPVAGDQLGYSVDVSLERSGTSHVIVAGAPGYDGIAGATANSGSMHIFRDSGAGGTGLQVVESGGLGWAPDDRMGSAVASDGGYLAVAGTGGQSPDANFQAYLLEPFGSNFLIAGTFIGTVSAAVVEAAANDYLDLVGRNLFLGRPGSGGQVDVFRDVDGSGFPGAPVDSFIPSAREAGDAIGFAVSGDRSTLVVGAPGDDDQGTDAGAVYTGSVPLSHTFVPTTGDWHTPTNWDTGVVPGVNDTAFLPSGSSVTINQPASVRVFVGSSANVSYGPSGSLTIPSYKVNSTGDGTDVTPGDGTCATSVAGTCTLRAAIQEANALAGRDTITFNIPGGGVQTISPSTPLPNITDALTIDGYTQAGSAVNTAATTSNATITVRLDGSAAGVATSGLVLNAPATVRGLAITRFSTNGIVAGFQTRLEGNFIGIAPDGVTDAGNGRYGVLVNGGDSSVFGGLASTANRNVISGNGDDGIFITGTATDNVVSGNLIGTDRTGTIAVPNQSGVCACTFGGVGRTRIERNLLSGNSAAGIYLASERTLIVGNLIGTAVSGLSALPNVLRGGVVSGFDSVNTQIGDGTIAGRNVISGNLSEGGISLGSTTEANFRILGNYIGVGADGTTAIPNSQGIWLFSPGATTGTIGGLGSENIIANNTGPGVRVDSGTGIRIGRNSMFDNGGPGILLGAGLANDADDPDTGPNNLQNSPEIISADFVGSDLQIAVSIDSAPANATAPIEIDFYAADSAVSGEGERYIGSVTLPVTPGGQTLSLGNLTGVAAGDSIVATATDANGNTSPFSAPVTIPGAVATAISLDLNVAAGSPSTVNIAPSGIPVGTIDRTTLGGGGGAGSVAASSIEAIGPQDTALAAITIGSTPLRAIVLDSTPLRAIPLADIQVNQDGGGGWDALLAGTDLENVPFVNITFGDALADTPASLIQGTSNHVSDRIAALPLRAIDVAGTPLRAIPIAAIALGSTPLRAIPLRAIAGAPNPWCAIVASLEPNCEVALDELNLMEITLRGVPLRAIPLRAIPLRAIDVSSTPLRAIPLRAIDLEASPLRAIPLRAIDLIETPLRAIPLRAIPLESIPLRAIPLRAIDLQAITVGSTPLRAIDLKTSPLRAIDVVGLSVDGTPLRAIPLRAIPLRAIDLEASPLRAIPLRAIPLRAIPLRAIDLTASPLRAIPLRAIDVQGSALASIPLRAIDLQATGPAASPLRAIPLRAIPLRAIPLRAIPLRAIVVNGTELRTVPLRAIDVLGSPLRAIPLRAITEVGAVNCQLVDCARATLGDAFAAGAVPSTTTLDDILAAAEGIRLGDIASSFNGFTAAQLTAAIAGLPTDFTMAELTTLDDLTLGDLPTDRAEFATITLGNLGAGQGNASVGDLIGRATNPNTNAPYTVAELQAVVDSWPSTARVEELLANQGDPGVLTVGDLLDASTGPVSLEALGSLLDYITVDQLTALVGSTLLAQITALNKDLGDLTQAQLGRMTLQDLVGLPGFDATTIEQLLPRLGSLLDEFTLGDLLLALVDPASLAAGGTEFDTFDERSLPAGTIGATTFNASFTLTAATAQNVNVEVQLPSQATYVAGSASVGAVAQEPTQVGQTLVWSQVAPGGATPVPITFDVLPALRLGATSLTATASVVGTDVSATSSASVTVAEGSEPNDFRLSAGTGSPRQTTPASEDVVYLSYIPTSTDIDVYQIELAENDSLVAQLSNLDADLDVVVWGRPADTRVAAALSPVGPEAPLSPVLDPDADGADAASINDFVRLDTLDPSLRLIATSNQSGTASEIITTDRLPAGTYFVQVYGANGATNVAPASLQLKIREGDAPPACRATSDILRPLAASNVFPARPTIPASANTLILVNQSRIERLYTPEARTRVTAAIGGLTTYLGANPELGVVPVVVPVDAYPAVRAAYAVWDSAAGSCDPEAANAVVAAINSTIIDPRRGQFEHIVFLGGDTLIPMARIADGTTVANEFDFRNELDGQLTGGPGRARNSVTAPFWESMIRSDEPYGDAAARRSGEGYLYVSDVALGRVVETPSEIADALDTFVSFGGNLSIETATVLGYDFLADGSEAVAGELVGGLGVGNVDRALASGQNAANTGLWNAADATEELRQAGQNALISLNAHFDYYRALPSEGDKVPGFDANLVATEVSTALGPEALAQSLVFSMGCHSGLSVSDVLVGSPNTDWAQTMGRQDALFVGNTGFGYGDTEAVAYTEELMRLFAERVTSPFALPLGPSTSSSTVGQALTWAKNDFVAGLQTYSVYDKKAVMESTFYGLPFYRVGLTPDPLPPTPTRTAGADGTGTSTSRVEAAAVNTVVVTPSGSYPANFDAAGNELVIVAPGRPIQPRLVDDISVVDPTNPTELAQVAHGAIVEDMSSLYTAVPDPVIATPVAGADRAEPDAGDVAFPTKPLEITTSTGPSGQRQQLVLATGQYRSDTGVQRLDSDIDVVVYYASPSETDFAAPTIGAVDSEIIGGRLAISTTVDDTRPVNRVYVLVVENPGLGAAGWTGVDLVRSSTTGRWTGSLVLTPGVTDVEFIVQAKDAAGNVGFATNKARNFDVDQPPAPPAPPAQVLTATPLSGPAPTGVYGGAVEIVVTANAEATYSVDGSAPRAVPTSGRFSITGDGPHTWQVSVPSGYSVEGEVLIDTAPPVVAADRATGGVRPNALVTLTAGDAGAAVASITYSVNGATPTTVAGASASLVLPGTGTTTVMVFATDTVGNASAPVSYTYTVDTVAPVVTGTLSEAANTAGWHRLPFQVVWATDDPGASVPPATLVNIEGVGRVVTSSPSCDTAGNCASGTVTVSLDVSAPDATALTNIAANGAGWNNAPVTVTVTCGPDLSGVVACPAPRTISTETDSSGLTESFSVEDVAGNVTSLVSRVIKLDRTPPTVTWTAPADGATVRLSAYTPPTCTVTDTLSGPNGGCTLDIPDPDMSTAGRSVYTAEVVGSDRAGNTTTRGSTYTVLTDEQGPLVNATPTTAANAAGWWRTPVSFTFTCSDPTGVASCPAPVLVSTEGANQQLTVTATDRNGNATQYTVSAINIDRTPPVLTVTAPTTVGPADTVSVTCAASDALSGLVTSVCADSTFPASTLVEGANVYTFSATDKAGNVTTTTRTITLVPNVAPVVKADMGVVGLEEIGFQTNVVVVNGTFADPRGPGPFTASVRWSAGGTFTPLILNNTSEFVAAFIYGSAGTRTVTVRICDAGGACGTDDVVVRTSVTQRITPVLQCVVDRGAATSPRYQARWGYNNPAPFAIAVPSIPILENTFTTLPFLRGQPQILLPGSQRNVFTTTFASGTSTWRINGNTASALSSSPRC